MLAQNNPPSVELKAKNLLFMNYMQEIDVILNELLHSLTPAEREDTKKIIKQNILESYKNGIEAGKKGGEKKPTYKRSFRSS